MQLEFLWKPVDMSFSLCAQLAEPASMRRWVASSSILDLTGVFLVPNCLKFATVSTTESVKADSVQITATTTSGNPTMATASPKSVLQTVEPQHKGACVLGVAF